MSVIRSDFGKTKDGQNVVMYRLENSHGAYMEVLNYGGVIRSIVVPDKDGRLTDVALGYENVTDYEQGTCFFGAAIGRSGNRIARGAFEIDGRKYQMPVNENENNLHSGPEGYDKRVWEEAEVKDAENSVTLFLRSPDGDQGFPGDFDIYVKYEISEDNEVILHYMGKTSKDTVANMTNHSYFNLEGHDSGSNSDILLQLYADYYTPVHDSASIPTGELAPVTGTPMDFTTAKPIGQDIDADFQQLQYTGGYDHNYAVNDYEQGIENLIACAYSPKTGIAMEVSTDLPGVQFYASNFVNGEKGKGGVIYPKRSGFCLETQFFPNSINETSFDSPILRAGEEYNSVTIYRFSVK